MEGIVQAAAPVAPALGSLAHLERVFPDVEPICLQVREIITGMSKDGSKRTARLVMGDSAGATMTGLMQSQLLHLVYEEITPPTGPLLLGKRPHEDHDNDDEKATPVAQRKMLKCFDVVKLVNYSMNMGDASGKKFLLLAGLDIVATGFDAKLGENTAATPDAKKAEGAPHRDSPITPEHLQAKPSWKSMGSGAVVRALAPQQMTFGESELQLPVDENGFRPISSLNPYTSHWVVRGQVLSKSEPRRYQNARGEGCVMSFAIADASGSIRVSAFNEVAEAMDAMLVPGQTVAITQAQLRPSNPKYNQNTDSNYEMTLTARSKLKVLPHAEVKPKVRLNLVRIDKLQDIEAGKYCDVMGIVQQVEPVVELTSQKTGEQFSKRTVMLVDESGCQVSVTLWRDGIELIESAEGHPVMLCRGVRRGEYGGVSLDAGRTSSFEISPDLPRAVELRKWYDGKAEQVGGTDVLEFTPVGGAAGTQGTPGGAGGISRERRTLQSIKDEATTLLDTNPTKPLIFSCRARVMTIQLRDGAGPWYASCPVDKKKLTELTEAQWSCEACNKSYEKPQYRYVLNAAVADESGQQYVSIFDDVGQHVLGISAGQLQEKREMSEPEYLELLQGASKKLLAMRVRVKNELYKEENRMRFTVLDAKPLNYTAEAMSMMQEIRQSLSSA
ncbi:Replication factor A protein 1 [Porphyridium purpureum]|uniref:Replication protein A subunit n=1 Tax=Porphyridium purpureum TaxID=35688 RepID=A0A5J4YXW5_PORPP|nr:Replication factor A protein 1 [Porphyridium purpureum]|eukprot:POR3577..scf209_3